MRRLHQGEGQHVRGVPVHDVPRASRGDEADAGRAVVPPGVRAVDARGRERRKLNPSLKEPSYQPLNPRLRTHCFQPEPEFSSRP